MTSEWGEDTVGAPPRERRSTRGLHRARPIGGGSSARAEIDPRPTLGARRTTGLLRASGDRPSWAESASASLGAPPRERRSTPSPLRASAQGRGSSARAEIDPRRQHDLLGRDGLLRASGDRPDVQARRLVLYLAPPRERRSTRPLPLGALILEGSSARAEIDPRGGTRPSGWRRLLRASGDRPGSSTTPPGGARAPPRERRSTRFRREDGAAARGSSARAEIDPPRRRSRRVAIGLLRASGDRPVRLRA